MTTYGGLHALLAAAGGLLLCWLMLIGVLVAGRPRGPLLREAMRLLPDLIRLLDASLPTGISPGQSEPGSCC